MLLVIIMGILLVVFGLAYMKSKRCSNLPTKEELFEGVEKPSSILVGMCIAAFQQDLKNLEKTERVASTCITFWDYSWENHKIVLSWRRIFTTPYDGKPRSKIENIRPLINGKRFDPSARELKQLEKAVANAEIWFAQYQKEKAELERQFLAVDLIESVF